MSDQREGLESREVPSLIQKQIDVFRRGNIHAVEAGQFNPSGTLEKLKTQTGSKAIGIDIGGDKALAQLFTVQPDGSLKPDESYSDIRKDSEGAGYVDSMEQTAQFAANNNLPVGISIGIPLDGTKPRDSRKLPTLLGDLSSKYSGNFAELFPGKLACLNDGPAGLMSGAIQANIEASAPVTNVIYVINGGGIGASVLKDGAMTATEAGHSLIIPELKRYDDDRQCGVFGATDLCIEQAASNKQGIEQIWRYKTGESISALEIERQFTENRPDGELSLELYDYSAFVVSHLVKGLANAFDIELSDPSTVIVGHGGAFKFPGYGERVVQILEKNLGQKPALIMTKDYSQNACAEGAAIAALTLR